MLYFRSRDAENSRGMIGFGLKFMSSLCASVPLW